tara:strand:+ start:1789 stop:2358 length:570 start_codon:yes stop_codon:yes gene_type:complete
MANRILVGRHPALSGNPYGFFVSKPSANVLGSTGTDFAFRSDLTDSTNGITSLNGQAIVVKHKGSVTAPAFSDSGAGQRQKSFQVTTWNRSDFNDGSNDRCPLVLLQTTVKTSTSTQNAVGYFFFRNSSADYLTAMGFHFEIFPFFTTTTGKIQCHLTAEEHADSDGDWPGTASGTRTVYYAICSTNIS